MPSNPIFKFHFFFIRAYDLNFVVKFVFICFWIQFCLPLYRSGTVSVCSLTNIREENRSSLTWCISIHLLLDVSYYSTFPIGNRTIFRWYFHNTRHCTFWVLRVIFIKIHFPIIYRNFQFSTSIWNGRLYCFFFYLRAYMLGNK